VVIAIVICFDCVLQSHIVKFMFSPLYIYIYMCVCVCVCVYVCIYIYVCMCVCLCIYIYIHTYTYIYIYIYTYIRVPFWAICHVERNEKPIQFNCETYREQIRREGDHWGDLGVDGWIILGWISRRSYVGIRTGLGWLRKETGGGRL